MRDSKDIGRISVDEESKTNDDNFRIQLKYKAKTNKIFRNNLKNAMCISNHVQNEIIVICHNMIPAATNR